MAESDNWAPPTLPQPVVTSSVARTPAPTGGVLTVIFGVVGLFSPFMAWIDTRQLVGDPTVGGMFSAFSDQFRETMASASTFEHVGLLALITSAVTAGIGVWMLVSLGHGRAVNKFAAGLPVLIAGLVCMYSGAVAMEGVRKLLDAAVDTAGIQPEDLMGIGMALAVLAGLGQFVMGIVLLARRSMTGN